ncbi:hypothetical protein BJ742DRAFT_781087 [Cladochytrium replicatum]|nr:hypothetical protein BJ742DRAFT_781087 [Cladochytrium replicatum]
MSTGYGSGLLLSRHWFRATARRNLWKFVYNVLKHLEEILREDVERFDTVNVAIEATLSKDIGGIGGIIFGKAEFEEMIERHVARLGPSCKVLSVPISSKIQALIVLNRPAYTQPKPTARFCRSELTRAGEFINNDNQRYTCPSCLGGRPTKAASLSCELCAHPYRATVGKPGDGDLSLTPMLTGWSPHRRRHDRAWNLPEEAQIAIRYPRVCFARSSQPRTVGRRLKQ